MIAGTAAVLVLVFGAAAMRLVVAHAGRAGAAYIVVSVRSVEVAQQLRLEVRKLRAGGPEQHSADAAIDSDLGLASALVQSDEEFRIVGQLRAAVDALRAAVAGRPGAPPLADAAQNADRAAEDLVAINVAQAHQAERTVKRDTLTASAWAGAAAAALALGVLTVVVWTHARILRPLALLRDRIRSVAFGRADSTLPAEAPAEVREVEEMFTAMSSAVSRRRHERLELLGRVATAMAAPLDRMMQVADGLSPEARLPPDRELRAAISTLGRELVRLRSVLDEYLEAARIEEGILELDHGVVDLAELVNESVELFRPLAPTTDLQLTVSGHMEVVGDARRLMQVVNNLLAIAVRHATAVVNVHIGLQRNGAEQQLEIATSSSAEETFERLYEILHGLDQAMLGVPGTGFTIQTSRSIVVALGGGLTVERRGDHGLVMRMVLPSAASMTARLKVAG